MSPTSPHREDTHAADLAAIEKLHQDDQTAHLSGRRDISVFIVTF
jgi:hypothetical protein